MIQGHSELFRIVEGSLAVVGLLTLACAVIYGLSCAASMRAQRLALEAMLAKR